MSEQTLTRETLIEFFGEQEFEKLCRHEAGHALIAFLFKRQIDYVRINNSKEKPSATRMPGSSLDGAFEAYFNRKDTFTLGVCNGCQMVSNLKDLIPGAKHWPRFVQNISERFEARSRTLSS